MNVELPLFKDREHNFQSVSTIDNDITPSTSCQIGKTQMSRGYPVPLTYIVGWDEMVQLDTVMNMCHRIEKWLDET